MSICTQLTTVNNQYTLVQKQGIQERSRNHCRHGKATNITYSECGCSLSYPACKAHAPCNTDICGLSGYTIFSHIISQAA